MNKNIMKIGIIVFGLCFTGALAMNNSANISQQQQQSQMSGQQQDQQQIQEMLQILQQLPLPERLSLVHMMNLTQQIKQLLQTHDYQLFRVMMFHLLKVLIHAQNPQAFQQMKQCVLNTLQELYQKLQTQHPQQQRRLLQQGLLLALQRDLQWQWQQQQQQIQQLQQQQVQLPSFDALQQSINQYNANQNQTSQN